jgi:hypothetical protein
VPSGDGDGPGAPPRLSNSGGAAGALAPPGPSDPAVVALRSQIAALQHELDDYKWVIG